MNEGDFLARGACGRSGVAHGVGHMESTQSEFVQEMIAAQAGLRLFLHSMLMDPDAADELLQRTNVVLCEKADEFTAGTNFPSWARRVAHFEVLTYRRRLARERQRLVFD